MKKRQKMMKEEAETDIKTLALPAFVSFVILAVFTTNYRSAQKNESQTKTLTKKNHVKSRSNEHACNEIRL